MIDLEKQAFVLRGAFEKLQTLPIDTKPRWGKMDVLQMVEHLAHFFDVSSVRITFELVTAQDQLHLYKAFLLSDKPFRENTKAPLSVIPEIPLPAKFKTLEAACEELRIAIQGFDQYFSNNPEAQTMHPVFGPLLYAEWILLHYKHLQHHLKQFGILD